MAVGKDRFGFSGSTNSVELNLSFYRAV